jgi:MFS transporter, DHA1 family, multidrug resistance protein
VKLSWRGVNNLFFACSAVTQGADGHLTAFTPLLLHDMGLEPTEVATWSGLLFAATTAASLPLGPFWGVLAERYSRRRIILRTYYCMAAALLVAAFAPNVWWLLLCRILIGLSMNSGGVITATQAMMTPRPHLARAIATIQASQPIAASIGPPLGALVIPWIGLRGLFLIDALLLTVNIVVSTLLMPEPSGGIKPGSVMQRMREVVTLAWTVKAIRWSFINGFMLRGATAVVDAYLPVRITQLAGVNAAMAIGWILGIYGALTAVATWWVGRIIERLDETTIYWRAMLFATVVTLGMALSPSVWLLGLLAAFRSIPVAFSNTVLFAQMVKVVPREHQTGIFGLAPTPRNFGGLVFPLGAAVIAYFLPTAALAAGALSYGGAYLAGIRLSRVTRRHLAAESREPVVR